MSRQFTSTTQTHRAAAAECGACCNSADDASGPWGCDTVLSGGGGVLSGFGDRGESVRLGVRNPAASTAGGGAVRSQSLDCREFGADQIDDLGSCHVAALFGQLVPLVAD